MFSVIYLKKQSYSYNMLLGSDFLILEVKELFQFDIIIQQSTI